MKAEEEMLPVLDEEGNVTGKAPRSLCHSHSGILHPVVHLHIIKSDRSGLLLQKRALTKQIQPGKWDTSVGGHVSFGEKIAEALKREAAEEASIASFNPISLTSYKFEGEIERELINCFACIAPEDYVPVAEKGEADSLRFWSWPEIEDALGQNIFTPNFEHDYQRNQYHFKVI